VFIGGQERFFGFLDRRLSPGGFLSPGVYPVQFLKTGFADFTAEGVEQSVGQTRTLNVRLGPAKGIERTQVEDLPIDGRNWATLTALAPGAIEKFQVQPQNFGADTQSGTAGGQVSVVSPSGTNAFHGQLFNYFRNDALDARTPFDAAWPDPFLLNSDPSQETRWSLLKKHLPFPWCKSLRSSQQPEATNMAASG
jgi:hypothetical protein